MQRADEHAEIVLFCPIKQKSVKKLIKRLLRMFFLFQYPTLLEQQNELQKEQSYPK